MCAQYPNQHGPDEVGPEHYRPQMFEADLADEKEAIGFYTAAAKKAADAGDIGSRTLFETIVMDEEGHMDWLDLLKRMGEPAYISKHISAPGKDSNGAD